MEFTVQDFTLFLTNSSEIFGVLNTNGTILKANDNWSKIFFKPLDEIIGGHIYDLVPPEDKTHYKDLFQEIFVVNKAKQHFFTLFNHEKKWITIDTKILYVDDLMYIRGREVSYENSLLNSLKIMSKISKTGVWTYYTNRDELTCSEECLNIVEYADSEPITFNSIIQSFKPEYKVEIQQKLEELLSNMSPFDFKGVMQLNGNEKWISIQANIINQHGDDIQVSGIISDITKEQTYIEQLKYNEETQRLALRGIKSGIFDHNLITDTVYYSPDFKRMLGLPMDGIPIPEEQFRALIHPDDVEEAHKRHLLNLNSDQQLYFNEYRLKNREGLYNYFEVSAWQKKDRKTGKTIRMIGNLINVEDKIQKQRSIKQYQRRLKAVINNGYLYTILLDVTGEILFVDESTKKAISKEFNIDVDKVRTNFRDVFPKNFDEEFDLNFKKALKGEKFTEEINRILSNGSTAWYDMSYTPITNQDNIISSILINFLNTTDRKKSEIQYREAKRKTEELSLLKSSILMNFSHEIRTPLNGIIGVNELLEKPVEGRERQELLRMQKESSNRLINTLERMISLSQMESLNSTLNITRFNVNKAVQVCFIKQQHYAVTKKLTYTIELAPQPVFILADEDLFKVAIDNLINNAIKYTHQGTIHISVYLTENVVTVKIEDTGIGIRKKNLPKIFEMFVQESQGLSREFEGTGIGLTMSKKYIELMDGKIKVKSQVNKGSSFTVQFIVA